MKINLISDLHLEFGELTLPGGDVLILSGDILEAKHLKPSHSKKYLDFFQIECAKYRHVIYVMGNHEHYGFRFDKTYDHLKDTLPSNIHLLEKESIEIDGILFIGGTLWTNCNNGDPITLWTIKQNMNDYRTIQNFYKDRGIYHKLTPELTYQEHKHTLEFIRNTALAHADKNIVVVTHHAPSLNSIHERFRRDYHMNGAFASNLSEFILDHPNIKVWTHGHTHDLLDYEIGQCRILCNPRGYNGYESRARDFDPNFAFEV